ncbi:MAG: hypothetical protein HY815_19045 [Candidatus Riflebacteria bacterium]|nr:hypothetical protein [Candidatus Riflebacteria bacterium]
MKKPNDPIDSLSRHVSGAIASFLRFLKAWREKTIGPTVALGSAKKPARSRPAKKPVFDWESILTTAKDLLAKAPTRIWTIGELCREVRKASDKIVKATGMHFGLWPRLVAENLVVKTGRGTFKNRAAGVAEKAKKALKKASTVKKAPRKASAKPAPAKRSDKRVAPVVRRAGGKKDVAPVESPAPARKVAAKVVQAKAIKEPPKAVEPVPAPGAIEAMPEPPVDGGQMKNE